MALMKSIAQPCSLCFCRHQLRSAVVYGFERSCRNALGRKMRLNKYLLFSVPRLCSRSKHRFAGNPLEEESDYQATSISDGSPLLNEAISVVRVYNRHHGSIDDEGYRKSFVTTPKDEMDDFDIALACKRFPSITLGSSPPIELYDETASYSEMKRVMETVDYEDLLLNPTSELHGTWPSMCPVLPSAETSPKGEDSYYSGVPMSPGPVDLVSEEVMPDLPAAKEVNSSKVEQESQNNAASGMLFLDGSLNSLQGLSKRNIHQLENCGFHTVRKLLHHFPRTYADLHNAQIRIDDGQYLIFVGKVLSSRGIKASYSFSFLEVVVGCEITENEASEHMVGDNMGEKKLIYLHLKKFFRGTRFTFQPFLRSLEGKHKEGDVVCVSGKVRTMPTKDHYEMREYNIDMIGDAKDSSTCAKERPYPIYPSKGGLNPDFLREIVARSVQNLPVNIDPIPGDITQEFGLLSLHDAYAGIHQPSSMSEADLARKRLIFDELFYIQLGRLFQMLEGLGTKIEKDGLLAKYRKPQSNAVYMEGWSTLTKKFLKALPYSLTSSQLNAVSEIIWDLKRPIPMNRLLQGDVGCGKTVVAFLACMEVIGSGYQAAFMVPTELLATQHYEHLLCLLEEMEEVPNKPSVALLTGSTPLKQARIIRQGLQSAEISLVIGTHSLISENVEFSALRIAVVDEQHRFGVIQRGRFNSKLYYNSASSTMTAGDSVKPSKGDVHMAPHVLAMSATPIPRTLALALYGDMSLTQITDLPPGRIPVETCIVEGNDGGFEKVYKMMLDELQEGGKVYLVYPVIEQSDQLPQLRAASADLEDMSNRFNGYSCGLLHGKMKSDEKDGALRRFKSGETHILLATQVIEIGVDVPDASMMVVMNAERFGIAQLHQLRGRVGRGVKKSSCILIASTPSGLSRLRVLEKSSDGFHLANIDLLLRGPGDLLGKKQSGHIPEFPIARLEADGNILQEAYLAALKILGSSHDLERFPALKKELSIRQPLCPLGD